MSNGYSMPTYFQNMPVVGGELKNADADNEKQLKEIEASYRAKCEEVIANGRPDDSFKGGTLTASQRIAELVDEGTWCPLNTLYNPADNKLGTTNILKGIGRVGGKWAIIIASDNKKSAGTWVPGQAENLLRASDTAKTLRIPLIYLLNCAGVQFDQQDLVYPNRRGGGTPFYRNAELAQLGVPVLVGIYGTNPAGGGYHSISPTVLIGHKESNLAVGGAGILSGMNPKGFVDEESARALIKAQTEGPKVPAPGSMPIHHDKTGFVREVYDDDKGVIEALKKYMSYQPAYNLEFFRVAPPAEPKFKADDLYSIITLNQKRFYNVYDVIARLFDGSELLEYKKDYGPEMITGLCKVDGLLVGVIANKLEIFQNYPEYRDKGSMGLGGKLYRQGLVKMNEFVTLCARDRIPIIWLQDTSGIDVGDPAEEAELLGLGQSLIYSIQTSAIPQLEITLRKASAAAHYVQGGPQGETNAFSIGTAASEYYVMAGETAASAMYVRQLIKKDAAGEPLDDVIQGMNDMIKYYHDTSRPEYCAKMGMVDEIVDMTAIRNYMVAFTQAVYQNPASICPQHQMMTPRTTRDYSNLWEGK